MIWCAGSVYGRMQPSTATHLIFANFGRPTVSPNARRRRIEETILLVCGGACIALTALRTAISPTIPQSRAGSGGLGANFIQLK